MDHSLQNEHIIPGVYMLIFDVDALVLQFWLESILRK